VLPNSGTVTYRIGDYLSDPLPKHQDLVTLIYCDLCSLSPEQRQILLSKVRQALSSNGKLILDVFSTSAFERIAERVLFGRNLANGFWSANDYFAFQHTFRYEDEAVSLDRFTVFESERTWKVYNWVQYFSHRSIRLEIERAGFKDIEFVDGFGVDPSDKATFGIVASV